MSFFSSGHPDLDDVKESTKRNKNPSSPQREWKLKEREGLNLTAAHVLSLSGV